MNNLSFGATAIFKTKKPNEIMKMSKTLDNITPIKYSEGIIINGEDEQILYLMEEMEAKGLLTSKDVDKFCDNGEDEFASNCFVEPSAENYKMYYKIKDSKFIK